MYTTGFTPVMLHEASSKAKIGLRDTYANLRSTMYLLRVLNLAGNSEHVAHAWNKIGLFGKNIRFVTVSRSNQMP